MRSLLLMIAPSRVCAFLASLGTMSVCLLDVLLAPFNKSLAAVNFRMLRSCQHDKVFNTIIRPDSIDVVDTFLGVKKPPQFFFHYKAVLKYVALAVAVWMVCIADFNIAIPINARSFARSPLQSAVAHEKANVLTLGYAPAHVIPFSSFCFLSATALTFSGRVGRGDTFSKPIVHFSGFFCSSPMTPNESLFFGRLLPATTRTKHGRPPSYSLPHFSWRVHDKGGQV